MSADAISLLAILGAVLAKQVWMGVRRARARRYCTQSNTKCGT